MQPSLEKDRSWSILILGLLGLSLLGLALLGFAVRPQIEKLDPPEIVDTQFLGMPPWPQGLDLTEFWEEAGFYTAYEEQNYRMRRSVFKEQEYLWLQKRETWILVPGKFGQNLGSAVLELAEVFIDQGWIIQIEPAAEGYLLGLWGSLPGSDERVLAYSWRFKMLNPRNHQRYGLGCIPLMGEMFDPWARERGTPLLPVLAIIIDDWGYTAQSADLFLEFPLPLTIAVLPHLRYSGEMSEKAHAAGHDVLLHQPMEAAESTLDLGPGGIRSDMDEEEILLQIEENLKSLPLVVGMNNHMGSKITADPALMEKILGVVKEEGLFFVDSYTTSKTVGASVAESLGVPYGVNNLFIDNENEVGLIKEQIRKGLAIAKRRGQAIIIGHIRPQTALALWEMIPEFLGSQVQLVPVSNLVQ
ncbi:MAG: divergent polysaccharide deacetylase family protein [Firmicutes bacterium]|nr:divergent polysaccharide deacetylase family protein [Bacillota bacterium]